MDMRWIVVIPAPAPAKLGTRLVTASVLGVITGNISHGLLEASETVELNEKIKIPQVCSVCGADAPTKSIIARRDVAFSDLGDLLGGSLLGKAKVEFKIPLCDGCSRLPAAPGVSLEGYGKRGDHWEVALRVANGDVAARYGEANPGATVTATGPEPTATAVVARRVVRPVEVPQGWAVEVDGVAGKPYDAVLAPSIARSPDGQRVAYAAKSGAKWMVVVDGLEGKPCDGLLGLNPIIRFSPDGQRTVYGAIEGQASAIVVDGDEYTTCDGVVPGSQVFSPDSRRFAYFAKAGPRWTAVVDGQPGPVWEGVVTASLTFSPDGSRLAFCAQVGGRWCIVADGVPGRPYPGILDLQPMIQFSADGRRYAFAAKLDGGMVTVVVDGYDHMPCRQLKVGSFAFSPDGEQISYQGRPKGQSGTDWTTIVAQSPVLA